MNRSFIAVCVAGCLWPATQALAQATAPTPALRVTARGDTTTWLGVSGQWRLRGESWTGFGAGAPASADHDDTFGLSRLLVRGEFRWRGHLSAVAELKSSLMTDRSLPGGRRATDEDVIDIQQLYAEGRLAPSGAQLTLRGGRFELALARERLVSPLDWTNTRRTFQGARMHAQRGPYTAQIFWVRPVVVRQREANGPDTLRQLYGTQLTRTTPALTAELYWLRSENRSAAFNGTSGADRRHSLGTRLSRRPSAGHVDADLELAWQTGSVGGNAVSAWMVGSQLGWSFRGTAAARAWIGFDAGSGDHDSGGTVETFNQLYPLGHAYLGYADMHGRQNVLAFNLGVSARPLRDVTLQLDGHHFRRASGADALYGVDGSVSRPAGNGLPLTVGSELDLTLRRPFAHGRLTLQAGASRYFAGDFLKQSGPGSDVTWVYAQATLTF